MNRDVIFSWRLLPNIPEHYGSQMRLSANLEKKIPSNTYFLVSKQFSLFTQPSVKTLVYSLPNKYQKEKLFFGIAIRTTTTDVFTFGTCQARRQ